MFKFALVFSLYVATALCLSDSLQELQDLLHGTCVEESGVSEAVIDKVNADKVLVDDPKLKCYIKCLFSQSGCMTDDGEVDLEAVIAMLPDDLKDEAAPVVTQCGAIVGADSCESAWLTQKCWLEAKPEIYVLL